MEAFTDIYETRLNRDGNTVKLKKVEEYNGTESYHIGMISKDSFQEWYPVSNKLFNMLRQELEASN